VFILALNKITVLTVQAAVELPPEHCLLLWGDRIRTYGLGAIAPRANRVSSVQDQQDNAQFPAT
jgi:hypothetical protein